MMIKQEAEKWLNDIIKTTNRLKIISERYDDIGLETISVSDYIQIYSGIEILADALGVELTINNEWAVHNGKRKGYKQFFYHKHEVFEIYDIEEVPFS